MEHGFGRWNRDEEWEHIIKRDGENTETKKNKIIQLKLQPSPVCLVSVSNSIEARSTREPLDLNFSGMVERNEQYGRCHTEALSSSEGVCRTHFKKPAASAVRSGCDGTSDEDIGGAADGRRSSCCRGYSQDGERRRKQWGHLAESDRMKEPRKKSRTTFSKLKARLRRSGYFLAAVQKKIFGWSIPRKKSQETNME